MDTISPVAVDQMSITVLMDNHVSSILSNTGPVTRPSTKQEISAPLTEDGYIKSQLRAEHGFSAWVTIKTGEVDHSILFDAGVSPTGVSENMRILD